MDQLHPHARNAKNYTSYIACIISQNYPYYITFKHARAPTQAREKFNNLFVKLVYGWLLLRLPTLQSVYAKIYTLKRAQISCSPIHIYITRLTSRSKQRIFICDTHTCCINKMRKSMNACNSSPSPSSLLSRADAMECTGCRATPGLNLHLLSVKNLRRTTTTNVAKISGIWKSLWWLLLIIILIIMITTTIIQDQKFPDIYVYVLKL